MPPSPIILRKGQLLKWANSIVSDHNRSELKVNPKRYENMQRMWNGTARKYVIAGKLNFSVDWTDLPSETAWTVDGKMGAKAMRSFWENNPGPFVMTITNGDGSVESRTVMITDFNWQLKKRAASYDMYDVSVELEEV